MRIVNLTEETRKNILKDLLKRSPSNFGSYADTVEKIVNDVRDRGDEALFGYTKQFDKADINAGNVLVTKEEIEYAYTQVDEKLIEVIRKAKENIRTYHEKQRQYSWFDSDPKGIMLGQKVTALESVGVYVPGGKAVYPSSVLMNIMPAKVAGVKNIIMTTPCNSEGEVYATTLVAANEAGATAIYKAGGAQAIAALAYGTESIPKVDKIVGPGNIFVALAKRAVYGHVSIDSIAGPSEILVIADETANPRYVAADLLSQAEHDEMASAILITTSKELAEKVSAQVDEFIKVLSRKEIIRKSIDTYGYILLADNMADAVEAANELLNLPNLPDSGDFVPINHTDIFLQDVSFSYDGTTQNEVLHGISLNIPQGSFTALVGPSGGGKSTVARLIARFWDVTGGSISIGGKNIKELSIHQLSELVSFVTQDNFLFNCSLKENIRLGNPNATDEEVYAAAKAACCDDFIARLEKGYDTPAGDAGKRLSGGEKQRIAIARAILKNAPIVILDEATAFTDPQNEDKIQKSIMALSKGKTLLVIAHRLSTIQNADQIVVLKKGQIVDCGKQGELLERCPLYADMWQAHIGAKNWSVGEKKEVAGNV